MSKRIEQYFGNGIEESFDDELKRAFDFDNNTVEPELRIPENVRLDKEKLRVSGDCVFYTLQGEGKTMGMPAVFLRLHVCNLRCVWCDAYYTWNPNTTEFWTESKLLSIDETKSHIESVWQVENNEVQKRLVITGGEPLLQKDKLDKLILAMGTDWVIEIETNGTIMPTDLQLETCQFNCSPKLANSQNTKQARVRKEVIEALCKADTLFKFVVMHNSDLEEIEADYIDGCGIPVEKVVLMPQGVTADEVRHNAQEVVERAKQKGYRLLGRLQNELWGARRGV